MKISAKWQTREYYENECRIELTPKGKEQKNYYSGYRNGPIVDVTILGYATTDGYGSSGNGYCLCMTNDGKLHEVNIKHLTVIMEEQNGIIRVNRD